MINYDDRYKTVFSDVSGTGVSILNHIRGISIDVHMPLIGYPANRPMRAWLTSITSHNNTVSITVNIDIPIVGLLSTIVVSNGEYTDEGVRVVIDYDSIPIGTYDINAVILLRNIMVNTSRRLILFGSNSDDIIKLNSGYNVQVSYYDDTLSITGGPGLGIGTYDGTEESSTQSKYSGLKSINGIRSDRNIDIKMSDLLIANSGGIK